MDKKIGCQAPRCGRLGAKHGPIMNPVMHPETRGSLQLTASKNTSTSARFASSSTPSSIPAKTTTLPYIAYPTPQLHSARIFTPRELGVPAKSLLYSGPAGRSPPGHRRCPLEPPPLKGSGVFPSGFRSPIHRRVIPKQDCTQNQVNHVL